PGARQPAQLGRQRHLGDVPAREHDRGARDRQAGHTQGQEMSSVLPRVTPRRELPDAVTSLRLTAQQRARVHMLVSLLLDYPDEAWFARLDTLREHLTGLPPAITDAVAGFIEQAHDEGPLAWQRLYVRTFDLKRK